MSELMVLFLIAVCGYLIGNIKIFGLKLGTSGVLIAALVFGHFGFEVPNVVREIGLACFVTSVGFIAGPVFFRNFKSRALSYIMLGFLIVLTGTALCVGVITLFKIPTPLALGLMTGALTSTPGLGAALEATKDTLASVGYGIAYPFGVIGIVLFVQIVPKVLKADIDEEAKKIVILDNKPQTTEQALKNLDSFGFFPYAAAVVIGLLIAKVVIPLPGGASFSLGTSGGPLIAGLVLGHFRHVGKLNITPKKTTLESMREFGLVLFLAGAGTSAGNGFVAVLQQYGVKLFLLGAVITLIPMFVGYFAARKLFKLELFNALGSICGGRTSTPALGTLISVAKTDAVAASYAATYPVALMLIVLACQFIAILL